MNAFRIPRAIVHQQLELKPGLLQLLMLLRPVPPLLRTGLKLLSKLIQLIIHRKIYRNSRGVPTRPTENCAYIVRPE
jgi:hypothetical protein